MNQKQVSENEDEINFDSFYNVKKELDKYHAGMARIMNCELVMDKSSLPKSYRDTFYISYDKYLILEAEKDESIIKVVIPVENTSKKGDLDYCLKWTNANSVDYLAGKRIPVKHIDGDIFRIEKFNSSVLKYLPISIIKKLIKNKIIKQEVYGKWTISSFYVISIYMLLLTPLFLVSYFIGELVSIPLLLFIIPYISIKLLESVFSR